MTFHAKDAQSGTAVAFATQTDPDGSDNVERVRPVRSGDLASGLTPGRKTVTTPGTPVPLVATSTPCLWVSVTALKTNTDQVNTSGAGVVAASGSSTGEPLAPGESVTYPISDAHNVFVDARVANEGVSYTIGTP